MLSAFEYSMKGEGISLALSTFPVRFSDQNDESQQDG
jgi:hypothetical protein